MGGMTYARAMMILDELVEARHLAKLDPMARNNYMKMREKEEE